MMSEDTKITAEDLPSLIAQGIRELKEDRTKIRSCDPKPISLEVEDVWEALRKALDRISVLESEVQELKRSVW